MLYQSLLLLSPPPPAGGAPAKKERKPRKKKDPNAPKKALSAFMYFSNANRERVKTANPGIPFGQVRVVFECVSGGGVGGGGWEVLGWVGRIFVLCLQGSTDVYCFLGPARGEPGETNTKSDVEVLCTSCVSLPV